MPSRPAIPADVSREIMLECGHRCAVCGMATPLERAHIIPWRETQDHSPENLICLCANCHGRADREDWGQETLREYKKRPWIHRNFEQAAPLMKPTEKLKLTIDMELASFDDREERWLRYALAAFLQIPPHHVKITAKKAGTVTITIELPFGLALRLEHAFNSGDAKLEAFLFPLTLLSVRRVRSIRSQVLRLFWAGLAQVLEALDRLRPRQHSGKHPDSIEIRQQDPILVYWIMVPSLRDRLFWWMVTYGPIILLLLVILSIVIYAIGRLLGFW